MTVMDDIFEVRPYFKKLHSEEDLIKRQLDKLLLRFYLKLTHRVDEYNN
jgi:hypothetical protein